MLTPAELLEQALARHGDSLFRVALLLSSAGLQDDAKRLRAAEALLRRFAQAWRESPPLTPPDEPALLARLVAVARTEAAHPRRAQRPASARRLQGLDALPLALYALLGYDAARIGQVLGLDEAAARATLIEAVAANAHRYGASLPDRVSGELCDSVRAALADPASGTRHAGVVRGHLASCAFCRAWDQRWLEIVQAAEGELRANLRDRTMPAALADRLVASARPIRRRISPSLRFALPPLAVLALIAALVLPGFLQPSARVTERELDEAIEPLALVEQALARHSTPPNRGGVWYGRFSTQWYFSDSTYAPLTAEAWLDPVNGARHRLQLTHSSGGAPYELQLGNGRDRLYYALDSAYAQALYGGLPTRARPESPALVAENLNLAGQQRALAERLASGPWSIPPFYLRQAQAAPDLRVLGRQREGSSTVQILSFSGVSPLGLPADAPGATAERVTVLLALDLEDGLLRSATELAGPAGAEQTSRVTWRLEEERWLATADQLDTAFAINRAWTGVGDFGEIGRHTSADPALPLISARSLADPARLLDLAGGSSAFWTPVVPPPGVDRALLLWPDSDSGSQVAPQGLIYLGPQRRMIIAFNRTNRVQGERQEALELGPWFVQLTPGRGDRYTLLLNRNDTPRNTSFGFDPSANLTIDARGFTRAELLAVVEGMRPFDFDSLSAQDALFIGREGLAVARTTLLLAAQIDAAIPPEMLRRTEARQFLRQAHPSTDPRADPYHAPLHEGRPPETLVTEWVASGPERLRFTQIRAQRGDPALVEYFIGEEEGWRATYTTDTMLRFSTGTPPPSVFRPSAVSAILGLLTASNETLALERLPNGGALVTLSEAVDGDSAYFSASDADPFGAYTLDLRPSTITTEIELDERGAFVRSRVYAGLPGGEPEVIASYTVLSREQVPFAELPVALNPDAAPVMSYTADFRDIQREFSSAPTIVTRTLAETLAAADEPIYVFDGFEPLYVEEGNPEIYGRRYGEVLDEAVAQGLARRVVYDPALANDTRLDFYLRITQGPAERFGGYLRSISYTPWAVSEPITLRIGGREVEAWLGQGQQAYLMFELDGTLLVVEGPREWFTSDQATLLDSLVVAPQP